MNLIAERMTHLSQDQRELLRLMLKEETAPLQPRPPNTEWPLSYTQQSLWFLTQLAPTNPFYNIPLAVRLSGFLQVPILEQAFNEIIKRHETLRTTFQSVAGKPLPQINSQLTLSISVNNLLAAPEATILERLAEEGQRPFDLTNEPLIRVSLYQLTTTEHILLVNLHHIIADGWSIGVLIQELAILYEAFSKGQPNPLPALPLQYADYAFWQREWLSGKRLQHHLDYWQQQLAHLTELKLPTDYPRPALQSFQGPREYIDLPVPLVAAVTQLSQAKEVTPFMCLLAVFQLLLFHYTHQPEIVVGTTIANRSQRELENLIGFFANTLVLRTDFSNLTTFSQLLALVKQVTLEAYAHQEVPFEMLVEHLHLERHPDRNPLFQVMFTLQTVGLEDLQLPGLTVKPQPLGNNTTHFDLEFHLWQREPHLSGYLSYSQDLFDRLTIERMLSRFQILLAAVVANPDQKIAEISLLTDDEQHWLQTKYQRSLHPPSTPQCVHHLLAARAAQQPDAIAIITETGEELSYQALHHQVDQLASYLQSLGRPLRVGISLEPSKASVVSILGTWQAGGVVVPLDPHLPKPRLTAILQEAQVQLILTQAKFKTQYTGLPCYLIEELPTTSTRTSPVVTPTSEAAVLCSSRSLSHAKIYQRLERLQAQFSLTKADHFLHTATPAQDSFLWEIGWPLMVGARLIFPPRDACGHPVNLPELIEAHAIHYIHFTPTKLLAFLKTQPKLSTLREVLCSGELLPKALVNTFFHYLNARLTYLYNPPEVFGEVSFYACQAGPTQGYVPAGPAEQFPVHLLDPSQHPVPIGVPGEIYITDNGLIKTGDQGRWLASGILELLEGQLIWQDGMRFNWHEIKTALLQHPAVVDAYVMTKRTVDQLSQELVAYVVALQPVSPTQLQEYLRTYLPEVMVPAHYVLVNTLPLTPSGFVDKQALARLEVIDADLIQRWERHLSSQPGIQQVKTLLKTQVPVTSFLAVADLLPTASNEPAVTISETTPAAVVPAVMAFADGGPLTIPEDSPTTLTEALLRTVTAYPEHGLTFIQQTGPEVFLAYPQLLATAQRILHGLQTQGLTPGDRVILQIDHWPDHFSTFWACVLGGIIPVTVAVANSYEQKNSVVNKLWNTWQLLQHPPLLANAHLVEALSAVPQLYETTSQNTFQIFPIEQLQQHPPSANIYQCQPTDVVFLQLTSGSTGIPKCIQETHRGIIHHIHGSQQFNGYTSSDITLNWLPMDHVVPILTCHLKDTYLGIQQIHVQTNLILIEPLKWLDLIESHRVTHTWAPNFGFKLVNDQLAKQPERQWDLASMKFFMNAGEQVTRPVVQEFLERLAPAGVSPQAMQPAFGMAEVCTCMTYQNHFSLATGVHQVAKASLSNVLRPPQAHEESIPFIDLGPPMPGVQIRITDAHNQLLPECVIGRFQIKGNVTTPGYLYNEAANQEAFVGDGWFNSGDLGFIKDGRLTLTGREKEMIIIRGANFYCYEIEDVVNNIAGVEPTFVAACSVEDATSGTEGLAIFFVPQTTSSQPLLQTIKQTIAKELGIFPLYVVPLAKSEFPKTTSGKIQRTQLKKALAAGQFDNLLKHLDKLPAWFYRPVWQRKELEVTEASQVPTLVFLDALGLGQWLSTPHTIQVAVGPEFTKQSPHHYQIEPHTPEHYVKLLTSLAEDHLEIHRIIHLWTYAEYREISSSEELAEAQYFGIYSLLWLAQALLAVRPGVTVPLLVVSSYSQFIDTTDKIAIERTPLQGLLKTLSQELTWLNCRHLDLPIEAAEINAQLILREFNEATRDREVAYRHQQRQVPRLEKADFALKSPLPFKRGGIYLLSGGLGGIGVRIARYLLAHYHARLILVGRTPLMQSLERLKIFQTLQALGGEVIYEAAEVGDLAAMQAIVKRATTQWSGELDGVLHLAGIFQTRLLSEETQESLAQSLHPKLQGSWVLQQLIKPPALFINFGSVNGFLGGLTVAAYAAANSFLQPFSDYLRHQRGYQSYCLAWSMWDEVGMSRGYPLKEQSRAQGYYLIETQQGLDSFLAGLHYPNLLIGLDASKPAIQPYVKTSLSPRLVLTTYYTGSAAPSHSELPDRFGIPTHSECLQVADMPVTVKGEIDEEQLLGLGQPQPKEWVAPRDHLEQTIASVWREILKLDKLGIYSNFFELGGQSILLVQVHSKLQQVLNRQLSIVELLRYPTISTLAEHLGRVQPSKPSYQSAVERAAKQKLRHAKPSSRGRN